MSKRHDFRPGEWESAAARLDEIISAHSGEDSFEEALKLLVAKLCHESEGGTPSDFLRNESGLGIKEQVNNLLNISGEKWRGIIAPGDSTKLSSAELERCREVLQSVRLLVDGLVGLDAIFEFIVSRTSKGQKGQYFTPRHVIMEIVRMMDPKPGEKVADPACGSGGFLHHVLSHEPRASVWGFDMDPRATKVARVLMAASDQSVARIMRTDSLRRPSKELFPEQTPVIEELMRAQDAKFKGFDLILTNPPFAGDVGAQFSNTYELARGKGRKVERDVLFIERCLELLKPGGRMAMVLPYNKVGGESWAYMRQWLIERMRIVAVVGLGRNTFMPHTSQKACVLVGIKRESAAANSSREEVIFFVSEKEGKDRRGKLILKEDDGLVDHDLDQAVVPVSKALCAHISRNR